MILDPFFYLCAVPAVILVGLAKGGFGGSISMIGVPIMALAVSPLAAAGIMLPILVVMDIVGLIAWRGIFHREALRLLLPASLVGVALGFFTASSMSADGIRLAVGLLCLAFALHWFTVARRRTEPHSLSPLGGAFWGIVSGFTSFVSHSGGPPFQIYVMPQRLEPAVYAGTTVIFFAVTNFAKLVPYFWLGQLSTANLTTALVLLPLAPLATLAGVWLVKRIDAHRFYVVTSALLIPVGLKLVYDGWTGL